MSRPEVISRLWFWKCFLIGPQTAPGRIRTRDYLLPRLATASFRDYFKFVDLTPSNLLRMRPHRQKCQSTGANALLVNLRGPAIYAFCLGNASGLCHFPTRLMCKEKLRWYVKKRKWSGWGNVSNSINPGISDASCCHWDSDCLRPRPRLGLRTNSVVHRSQSSTFQQDRIWWWRMTTQIQ